MIKQAEQQFYHAIELKNEGRYVEARAELESIVAAEPDDAGAHWQLGLVYGFMGLFDESLTALIKAARLGCGSVEVHNDLGLTYCMLGMWNEAKAEFEYVLSEDPENEVARKNIRYFL